MELILALLWMLFVVLGAYVMRRKGPIGMIAGLVAGASIGLFGVLAMLIVRRWFPDVGMTA